VRARCHERHIGPHLCARTRGARQRPSLVRAPTRRRPRSAPSRAFSRSIASFLRALAQHCFADARGAWRVACSCVSAPPLPPARSTQHHSTTAQRAARPRQARVLPRGVLPAPARRPACVSAVRLSPRPLRLHCPLHLRCGLSCPSVRDRRARACSASRRPTSAWDAASWCRACPARVGQRSQLLEPKYWRFGTNRF
jgi:hypothetical protein